MRLFRNVTHYSYFGSFRSFTSNVGYNVSMLNSNGQLTDIGSWYLGGDATGVVPGDNVVKPNVTASKPSTPTYVVPALVTEDSDSQALIIRPFISYFGLLWPLFAFYVTI